MSLVIPNLISIMHPLPAGNTTSRYHKMNLSRNDIFWIQSFKAAMAKGSRDSGIFGLRLQRHSFEFFYKKLAVLNPGADSDKERFEASFGKTAFIHLTRSDKLAQAISYVKAEQTGLWHKAADGTELERSAPPQKPHYDHQQIQQRLSEFTDYDIAWRAWFSNENIKPLQIDYEVLSANPGSTLTEILAYLGIDYRTASNVRPGVLKLADETNQEWSTRFRMNNLT